MIQTLSNPTHGRRLASQIIGAPAPGANILITVPNGVIWEPNTLHAQLVNAAAAGNRRAQLQFTVGIAPCVMAFIHDTQPPTVSNTYHWLAGYHEYFDFAAVNETYQAFPKGLLLRAGDTFGTVTIGIQALDQWDNIAFSYFETLAP